MRSLLVPFALNLSFALLAAQSATAQKFAITDLGTLPGGMASVGYGINSSGQVTGYSETSDTPVHAFLYSKGKMSDLGTLPGGDKSVGNAISGGEKRGKKERGREDENADTAQVTGYANIAGGANHAFLYRNGKMSDLGVPCPPSLPTTTATAGDLVSTSLARWSALRGVFRSVNMLSCIATAR